MAVAAVDRQKRPGVDLLATPIDKAIAFGCNAPNPHNTQAWKFRHTSELETLFYVDEAAPAARDRSAGAADPHRLRLLHRNLVGRCDDDGLRNDCRGLPRGNVRPG